MPINNKERAELLELYKNAAKNLSELKNHSFVILASTSALVGFVFINLDKFLYINRCLFVSTLLIGLILSAILYWLSRVAFNKHRDRIKNIRAKLSQPFQECYETEPGPPKWVDNFYLFSGIAYLIVIFVLLVVKLFSS